MSINFRYIPNEPQYSDVTSYISPLWAFRGYSSIQVETFDSLSSKKFLVNGVHEFLVDKIAVHKTRSQKLDYIYLELVPEKPVGNIKIMADEVKDCVREFGYFWQEYALIGKTPITLQSWEDGAAEINGRIHEVPPNTRTRKRYLTKYNILITTNSSPYNSNRFETESTSFFNKVLTGQTTYDELFSWLASFTLAE